MKKRILSILLLCCMVLTLLPTAAFAAGKIWVGTEEELLAALADNAIDKITLTADITVSQTLVIDRQVVLVLDHSLKIDREQSSSGTLFHITKSGYLDTNAGSITDNVLNEGKFFPRQISGEVINEGEIIRGSFSGKVKNRGSINYGSFRGEVENAPGGKIANGELYGEVTNHGEIAGWKFYGKVTNDTDGLITSGEFYGEVVNNGIISYGKFYGDVVNNGTITGGSFFGTLTGSEIQGDLYRTVTFDSDGGSAVAPQQVLQGQKVQRPAAPTKDGYTFIGWYNKADLQYINLPEWNFDYPVFENMELVAQWMEARQISTDPITYLDKDGNQQVCTAYTVLTSETKESILDYDDKWYDLPAGWYVVEGDVTITPRVDTHGAVNLILTNGSHLTAEWGIDVKVGDTFTVYAQSTDEGTMGRLTACLPADFNLDRMVHYSVWPDSRMAGIGSSARWRAGNDGIYESEGTIVINGGNIRARGQDSASAIGGPLHDDIEFRSTARGEVYNRRQGGSITINGGVVRTEPFALSEGNPLAVISVGIGTCQMGYGGSVTINGGTVIAEAANDAITTGDGGTITINGGDVTARGGVNNFGENSHRVLSGNGIGPLINGSIIINGGTVKATAEGNGFGIGGSRFEIIGTATVTINGGTIEATANRNNAAIGDKGKGESGVTINDGVIHAVGKGGAAGIGSKGDIRITGGELTVSAEGSGAAIGGFTDSYSERVDCKSITINGDVIKSISSKDGACIGAAAGGSVGSIAISNAELSSLSAEKILIGWGADSPGGKLTIRNCRVASTDTLSALTDGIRVGSNSEIVIEESEIRLLHLRGIRVGGNGSIAVRDSDLHTYGIFMDETVHTITDAKTLKKLEITDSTVLTGDIIGARGEYSSVEEIVIRGSSIRLNEEYTYNRCTIGGGEQASFGSIDIQDSQIDITSSLNAPIGSGLRSSTDRESRIRIANSQVSVRNLKFGPAIGSGYTSHGGRMDIIIENSTVTAKGGNLRSDTDYIPGIGKNASGCKTVIGIQILNSTVDSFRLTERGGTDYVHDDLHIKELPGIPPENITICGSTVNGTRIDHSPDEYGKCALCGKYDIGYCYESGRLTMEGLTGCVSDGSEKKLTGLSHQTGENETKQLAENTDYIAVYSNNVHPYTLAPDDVGFDPAKAPKVTLYGAGNYCGKAEHYFTISTEAPAAEHTITVKTDGNGTASASLAKAAAGTEITLTATPNEGYHFKEWEVMSGGVTIKDDKFTMPSANVEVKAIFKDMSKEQFTLAPGGTYYFDLSAMGIPGTVNGSLPDASLHYVPFTYAGTMDAYKLMSTMATTEEYAEQNKYDHSLFVADFAVTHALSWDNLNAEGLIFGKGYATGSVDYTLRAPSGGSGGTGSGALERGTPQSNEWDRILDKDDGYIKNWRNIGSWGQDTLPNTLSNRVIRGRYDLPRKYTGANTTLSFLSLGFRPVLEVLNPGTLGSDGLKAVTLDLGGGKLGGSSDTIQIIVKTGESFTAPASEGLTRPDGNTGRYFMWLGSDGNLYAPGKSVPAVVTTLTAQFVPPEQFNLAPDGTYYFDLSGVSIPGTVNGSLPDSTLHYVPFTYAGTVDAYALTSEMATTDEYAQENNYDHSLFIADYNVTHTVSWDDLNTAGLIFDKDYAAGGVDYTLRAPSAGSSSTGPSFSIHGAPQSNEWDRILDKDERYIQNIVGLFSWGQDTPSASASQRVGRGYYPLRGWSSAPASYQTADAGFRPVLEVLGLDKLGYDGLKAVTLDLGGGKLGNSSEDIQIIVKSGKSFAAPASDGLTRPDGNSGSYFKWLGSDGELYAPDGSVPANVNKLTAQFAPDTYTVTIITEGGGTASASHAKAVAGTEITLTATPNTGYHFKAWQVISGGVTIKDDKFTMPSANVEVKAIFEKDAPPASTEFTITVRTDGNGTASASHAKAVAGTEITLTATPNEGYRFKEWQVISGGVTIKDDKFTMPSANVEVKAIFEEDAPPAPTEFIITVKTDGNGTASASHAKAAAGTEITLTATPNEGYRFKEWQVISGDVTIVDDKFTMPDINVAIKAIFEEDAPPAPTEFTITVKTDGNGTASASLAKAAAGTEITLTATPDEGYHFHEWQIMSGGVTIKDDKFLMPDSEVEIKAIFEEDASPAPTEYTITVTTEGGGTASASPAKAATGTEITLTATPKTGYHLKEWQVISGNVTIKDDKFTMPDSEVEIKAIFEKDAPPAPTEFTITVKTDGNGTASASPDKAVAGTEITLTAKPVEGYHLKEWEVMSGGVTIVDDKFIMPDSEVEIKAIFEEDAPPVPTDPAKPSISVTGTYTYNGSEHTATMSGYDPATMDISGNTATDAGDYTVSVTSKTSKWADGSTDAVTAAWKIGKATREAPNGLTGVAPTTKGGSDGKITGVDATMEYRAESETIYTACTGIEIENLPAGNYFVRYAKDNNHFASSDTVVTVGDGAQLEDFTITFDGNGGSGSMDSVTVKAGTNYTLPECGFTAPDDQEFKAWEIGGTEYKVGDSYTVLGDTEIKALWENSVITPTTYTVTVNNDGNGTAFANPSTAEALTEITLTATPNRGYHFKQWQVESPTGLVITNNKFLMPNGDVEIKAIFEKNTSTGGGTGTGATTYPITVMDSKNGDVTASHKSAAKGTTVTLTVDPDKGYVLDSLTVLDGKDKERKLTDKGDGKFTFTMPADKVTVEASFKEEFPDLPNPFSDLAPSDFCYDAVMWAVGRDITGGIGNYTFGPNLPCTRAQAVTFLWRAAGSPEPETRAMPFTDVPVGSYYYNAVLWAIESGITEGTSDTMFSPDATCSRAQIVTFLWRAGGSPAASGNSAFTDVASDAYYAAAVIWAEKNDITGGIGGGLFGSNNDCTRGQIVTFLYRSVK